MIYFSHRGSNTVRVQNTVEAFRLAHAQGARNFELDVHLLKDGHLAVYHDYSLLSATGENIKLADLSAEDLQQIPLPNPFSSHAVHVPLLEEILPIVTPGLEILNIEIKNDDNVYCGIEQTLLPVWQGCPRLSSHILFSSFDYETLVRIRKLLPTARVGLLTRAFDPSLVRALSAESVHIKNTRFTPEIARECHHNQWRVYVYTVNDKQEATQLAQNGADGIFTDCIPLFI